VCQFRAAYALDCEVISTSSGHIDFSLHRNLAAGFCFSFYAGCRFIMPRLLTSQPTLEMFVGNLCFLKFEINS
jgi:hypothetical protein